MSSASLPQFAHQALNLDAFFEASLPGDWEQAASEALRGTSLEQLSTRSLDQLSYQPLYSASDLPAQLAQNPASGDLRRGRSQPGWLLTQAYSEVDSLLQHAATDLLAGVERIQFEGPPENLQRVLQTPGLAPVQCLAGLSQLSQALPSQAQLNWLWDSWSDYLQAAEPEHQTFKTHQQPLQKRLQAHPTDRVFISSRLWHEAGASASLELATMAACLVESLQALRTDKLTPQQILNQTTLELSAGPELFLELAKCRAARIIIQRVAEAYGSDTAGIHWQARTSRRFLSRLDRYNNLLRQTLSALACILGGAQSLITEPLDILNPVETQSATARRLARNLQLILKHEVHLDQWVDPAGGSYLIERLTDELAESAWQQFQYIEAQGGLLQHWPSGQLQQEVSDMALTRQRQAATRQQTLVGVNLYATAEMTPPAKASPQPLRPLQALRLAAPFEALRQAHISHPIQALLIPLGSATRARARLEFASAFFAVAGCEADIGPGAENSVELEEMLTKSDANIRVLCGTDADYDKLLSDISLPCPEHSQLVLAGKPSETYRRAGVQHFIFAGCDLLASFKALKPEWFA